LIGGKTKVAAGDEVDGFVFFRFHKKGFCQTGKPRRDRTAGETSVTS
jgi:hypothetical protein